jgi:hypothetical protein
VDILCGEQLGQSNTALDANHPTVAGLCSCGAVANIRYFYLEFSSLDSTWPTLWVQKYTLNTED